jgi:hypothetical protein
VPPIPETPFPPPMPLSFSCHKALFYGRMFNAPLQRSEPKFALERR